MVQKSSVSSQQESAPRSTHGSSQASQVETGIDDSDVESTSIRVHKRPEVLEERKTEEVVNSPGTEYYNATVQRTGGVQRGVKAAKKQRKK